jgi:hypothetical protein
MAFYIDHFITQIGLINASPDSGLGSYSLGLAGLASEHVNHSVRAYGVTRYDTSAW